MLGCDRSASVVPAPGRLQRAFVTVGGARRSYLVARPAPRFGRAPLLLAFHGYSSSATKLAATSGIVPAATAAGFVAVLPEGSGTPPRWALPGRLAGGDDATFVRAVLAAVARDTCIDLQRVYATGFSNGAAFTGVLACRHPRLFRGIALVGGANLAPPCAAERARADLQVVLVHGRSDRIVPLAGGPVLGGALRAEPFAVTVARWRGDPARPVTAVAVPRWGHRWPPLATREIMATFDA